MSRILHNNKALIVIIIILLLVNITLVAFFIGTKPPPRKESRNDNNNKERLSVFLKDIGFDQQQLSQFDSLRKEHWSTIKPLFKGMNASKDRFYQHLSDSVINEAELNIITDSIGLRQKDMDRQVFNYFRSIRGLCTEGQKPVYDSLIQNVVRRMISPYRKKGENQHNKKPASGQENKRKPGG